MTDNRSEPKNINSEPENGNSKPNHPQATDTPITYTDVIIVGAGPIGLSMCQALKDSGLTVHLIEKQSHEQIANPQADGREIAITHRTKHLMQQLDQWRQIKSSDIYQLKRAEVYNGQSPFALSFDKPEKVNGRKIETLGYLLSNHHIRKSAYQVLAQQIENPSFLTAMFEQNIANIETNTEYAQVTLANGEIIRSQLILGADSRVSFVRKALGISADMHDFGRTVLLFRCQHTLSNHETAHEGFYYGKTLAVLPLGEYESSMVITIDNSKINEILSLDSEQLAGEMMVWLNGSLGKMTVSSDTFQYPLLAVHADKFYGVRSALIGDSAVGMHPVTAHGYNLGMESVDILSRLICQAVAKQQDIASPQLLKHYHRKHNLKTRPIYHGTNTIVKLYTDERKPAKLARHIGLRISDNITPVKKLITAQLTG